MLTNALAADKRWAAEIPIVSTHVTYTIDRSRLIPNTNGVPVSINMLDMMNPININDITTQCHFSYLQYPATRGSTAILQIEGYTGSDDSTIKSIQNNITSKALDSSTKLKSKIINNPRK